MTDAVVRAVSLLTGRDLHLDGAPTGATASFEFGMPVRLPNRRAHSGDLDLAAEALERPVRDVQAALRRAVQRLVELLTGDDRHGVLPRDDDGVMVERLDWDVWVVPAPPCGHMEVTIASWAACVAWALGHAERPESLTMTRVRLS